ncbi:hypothetical protein RBH26_20835 [Natronolimnohabitans sp. A-GB9]|uniref:hypothetical protein n=1 Tax=Natronolimnohabitans sp. A-GB9 TaxID=3069757 RepID=UPI0027AFF0F7|nr:hypothetical protein [Natronolimnohabitans sp. A-GB9]MDQ2052891.1 hypothetical protein [Natronolimnohabitans sp. A-GB9]
MGADNHSTSIPTNFEEVEGTQAREIETNTGDQRVYHMWIAEVPGADLTPTYIYIRADSLSEAWLRAQHIGMAFGVVHPAQVELHPVELYV